MVVGAASARADGPPVMGGPSAVVVDWGVCVRTGPAGGCSNPGVGRWRVVGADMPHGVPLPVGPRHDVACLGAGGGFPASAGESSGTSEGLEVGASMDEDARRDGSRADSAFPDALVKTEKSLWDQSPALPFRLRETRARPVSRTIRYQFQTRA